MKQGRSRAGTYWRAVNENRPPPGDPYWNTVPLFEAFLAWRHELVTVEQIESAPILYRELPLRSDFPSWQKLKALMQPGDELWTFDSPQRFWRDGMGWQGILLVRLGEVCVTAMN